MIYLQIVTIILTTSPPVTVWQIVNKTVVGPAGECQIWPRENILFNFYLDVVITRTTTTLAAHTMATVIYLMTVLTLNPLLATGSVDPRCKG